MNGEEQVLQAIRQNIEKKYEPAIKSAEDFLKRIDEFIEKWISKKWPGINQRLELPNFKLYSINRDNWSKSLVTGQAPPEAHKQTGKRVIITLVDKYTLITIWSAEAVRSYWNGPLV